MEAALIYLGFKARTEREVRQKLLEMGYQDIEETIAKLKSWKYLDDEDFVKNFVQARSRARPQSQRSLNFELQKKGLTVEVRVDDLEMARAALAQKKNLKTYPQRVRFLASRGFSWDTIEKLVKKEYN